jgi:hypothetical protein
VISDLETILLKIKNFIMKTILTLLLSAGLFSASFGQGNSQHKRHYNRNDQYANSSNERYDNRNDRRVYNNRNVSYKNQRAIEIQRINREYNYKVQSIENNRYMKNHQKKRAIRDAKKERINQIQMLNARYNDHNNHGRYHDDRR